MSRPDLIIILTDEERAAPSYENHEIRAWRNEHLPARAWFADNGVSFERHYVASTACAESPVAAHRPVPRSARRHPDRRSRQTSRRHPHAVATPG